MFVVVGCFVCLFVCGFVVVVVVVVVVWGLLFFFFWGGGGGTGVVFVSCWDRFFFCLVA